jgi:hypothetical protein
MHAQPAPVFHAHALPGEAPRRGDSWCPGLERGRRGGTDSGRRPDGARWACDPHPAYVRRRDSDGPERGAHVAGRGALARGVACSYVPVALCTCRSRRLSYAPSFTSAVPRTGHSSQPVHPKLMCLGAGGERLRGTQRGDLRATLLDGGAALDCRALDCCSRGPTRRECAGGKEARGRAYGRVASDGGCLEEGTGGAESSEGGAERGNRTPR